MGYTDNYKKLYKKEILRKSLKIILFGLKTAIRLYEVGITSNRRSASYGEFVLRPCTHRPSHAGREPCLKLF